MKNLFLLFTLLLIGSSAFAQGAAAPAKLDPNSTEYAVRKKQLFQKYGNDYSMHLEELPFADPNMVPMTKEMLVKKYGADYTLHTEELGKPVNFRIGTPQPAVSENEKALEITNESVPQK